MIEELWLQDLHVVVKATHETVQYLAGADTDAAPTLPGSPRLEELRASVGHKNEY